MKQRVFLLRVCAALLALSFLIGTLPSGISAFAEDGYDYSEDYNSLSPEEKQALLEQKIKETDEKLEDLGERSEETKEYIDTLDEKISYLRQELDLSQKEIEQSKTEINTLEKQFQQNEKDIAQLEIDIASLSEKNEEMQEKFSESYAVYCQRVRALYISGETSVLSMLLTCKDISNLFTRLEMIKRVSKADSELLQSVQNEANEIVSTQTEMKNKQTQLTKNQTDLKNTEKNLSSSITALEKQQVDFEQKETAYKSEKNKSDTLLEQLENETKTYSEYRNQDQAELEAVNAEIAAAAEEFRKRMEAQTTTKKPTTTKQTTTKQETTTQAPTATAATESTQQSTTSLTTTTTTTTKTTNFGLRMTYPVPSQTRITCDFGSAGYAGHTGVDFSCPSGSTVVAAESGYVFYIKLMNTSYGNHLVIMHDKTDSAGNYVYTLYAHNSSILVSTNQYVKKGQAIAKSGSTGNSTGPHCHFEVRTPTANYSDCVNPNYYLP